MPCRSIDEERTYFERPNNWNPDDPKWVSSRNRQPNYPGIVAALANEPEKYGMYDGPDAVPWKREQEEPMPWVKPNTYV